MTTHPIARPTAAPASWNWAHLGLLAGMAVYAALTHRAAWPPTAVLLGGLVLTLLWLGVAERLWPYRTHWAPTGADLRRDASFLGINFVASGVGDALVRALAVAAATRLWHGAGPAHALPLLLAVPLAVLLGELGAYALHRASHCGGWLWRVHSVHHRPEVVNTSNNATTHPVNVLLIKLVQLSPWVLLGFSTDAIVFAALFVQTQSFATHANVRGRMGWLNGVIGTAELHRRHHSTQPVEAQNFSTAIPLWDMVFGTYRGPATPEAEHVGLQSNQGHPAAHDLKGLLRHPLRCCPPH